jgi:CRP/FNR family cyclic AMP-dependent transcriptional regulator
MVLTARRLPDTAAGFRRPLPPSPFRTYEPPATPQVDDVHAAARAHVLAAGQRHVLARGGVAYSQGDQAASIGWVIDGRLMLSVVSDDGREVILGIACAGDMFGETALGAGQPRATTAIALEPATIVQVDARDLAALSREHADVAAFLVDALLTRVADLQARLADHMMQGSEARLVHLLLQLASAEDVDGAATLPLVSQEVLAQMVGTTRSRVNVLLRGLRAHGVEPSPTGIHVHPGVLRHWHDARREA